MKRVAPHRCRQRRLSPPRVHGHARPLGPADDVGVRRDAIGPDVRRRVEASAVPAAERLLGAEAAPRLPDRCDRRAQRPRPGAVVRRGAPAAMSHARKSAPAPRRGRSAPHSGGGTRWGDALVELRVATTFIPLRCSAGLANGVSWFLDGWAVLAIYHHDSESWSQLLSVWIARDPGGRTALNHFLSEQGVPPAALLS